MENLADKYVRERVHGVGYEKFFGEESVDRIDRMCIFRGSLYLTSFFKI